MMLMTEKLPNITRPQNLVNSLMPVSSKLSRSIRPKAAQNKVCEVSQRLRERGISLLFVEPGDSLGEFPVGQAMVYFYHYLLTSLVESLHPVIRSTE